MANSDGTDLDRLSFNADYDGPLSFSLDGKLIYVHDKDGASVIQLSDGSRRQLATGYEPAISAHGRKLIIGVHGPKGIGVLNSDGSNFAVVHSCGAHHSEPTLSHDGKLAAWVERPDARAPGTILIMNLETSELQTVSGFD